MYRNGATDASWLVVDRIVDIVEDTVACSPIATDRAGVCWARPWSAGW